MPSADRRQKQRIAKARAIAQASARESEAAASATATDKTASAVGSPLRRSNKSCQTIMSAQVVQSLIEAYWADDDAADLDRRHVDQATEPMQFIVSSYSAMSTSAPSRNQREEEAYYYENNVLVSSTSMATMATKAMVRRKSKRKRTRKQRS